MKKILSCLLILFVCTGCSCTPGGSNPSPSPSMSPSAMPSTSPTTGTGSAYNTKDYIDYLAQEYTLKDPATITDLDTNAMEGYTFGLNNQTYYLVRFDPTNTNAMKWMNGIDSTGKIEVTMDGLAKNMYAMINGDYALISDNNEYMEGFKEYYDQFTGQQAMPSGSPTPSASPKA